MSTRTPPDNIPKPTLASALARVRLRHLQALAAVARSGSLRAAAEQLSLTQPAVTKQLNELEGIVGQRLLQRDRRGTVLTAVGHEMVRHVGETQAALKRTLEVAFGTPRAAPVVRVGVLPTLAPAVLPRMLARFRRQDTGSRVSVVTAANDRLVAALQASELDLAIGRLAEPKAMAGLSFESLFAEPLVVAVRAGHALARKRSLAPGALAGCSWVLPLEGTVIRQSAERWFAAAGVGPPGAAPIESLSMSLAREWVLGGDALWIAPLSAVEAELARGTLSALKLDMAGTEEPIGLLQKRGGPMAGAAETLAAAVRDEARQRRGTLARR
jgi:LysR family transcriptional regulator, pca operon transcriptional activator